MTVSSCLATGQSRCYDAAGREIRCAGSGQDGEWLRGVASPGPRFACEGESVCDRLTGLSWLRDADLTHDPVDWTEALQAIDRLNAGRSGATRWRSPNINELESLVDCARHSPAVTREAVFTRLRSGYWSSTTSTFEPDWAWALYLDKGAVGVGQKAGVHFCVWAVRDERSV